MYVSSIVYTLNLKNILSKTLNNVDSMTTVGCLDSATDHVNTIFFILFLVLFELVLIQKV